LGEGARKQTGLNPPLLDLDGTLIESVYQHVLAWSGTLHEVKINLRPTNRKE
jgi:beta-phosphoglucomutase-like phosphatase (HAD superfamily)